MLHDDAAGPERALRDLDADRLAHLFAINTIGPALALKHFAPLLAKDVPATIACISARVGSIADNRLGGWYGYRASKAALNQIVRTAAIELARTRPQAMCVALHPGTVDTGLSKPFKRGVPAEKLFTPAYSADRLLAVLDGLAPAQSGRIFAWDGAEITP
jgi:NAD(P)-dependent dehydrogenase (short-subunit alcohol dehydrogenase family)